MSDKINEDVPANNIAGGNIAGAGLTADDVLVPKNSKILKRKKGNDKMTLTKEQFDLGVRNTLAQHIYVKEAKQENKQLTSDEKQRLMAAFEKGKDAASNDEEEKKMKVIPKKDLYVWKTSSATKDKLEKIIDDFNKKHEGRELDHRFYIDATLSKLYLRGDTILRKQLRTELESAGAKKVKVK